MGKKILLGALVLCICAIGGYFYGVYTQTLKDLPKAQDKSIVIIKRDTVEVKDTFFTHTPQPYKVLVYDTVFVSLERDTLLRESKMYRDSTYKAWISGIDATLDSIQIYNRTKYITHTEKEFVREGASTLSNGLFVTIGINTCDNVFLPSVGLNYNHGKYSYGVNVGVPNKIDKPFLGINVGYKLK